MRLFLHIGMNKTGSSALQECFRTNRRGLAREGVLYPFAGIGHGMAARQHLALATSLGFASSQGVADDRRAAEIRRALEREIAACRPHTVVLSSEVFVRRASLERVQRFLDRFEVRILVYLRRHDHWWSSLYSQAVRTVDDPPWEPDFRSYQAHQISRGRLHFDYSTLLRAWGDAFGHQNLIVRPYEPAQVPDIVDDALEHMGRPDLRSRLRRVDARINPSLSATQVAVIDALQRIDMPLRRRHRLIKAVTAAAPDGERASLVPPSMRRELVEQNRASYSDIARRYLARPDRILFREPDPDAGEDDAVPDPADAPAIVRLLLQALD